MARRPKLLNLSLLSHKVEKLLRERGYTRTLEPHLLDVLLKHEGGLVDNPRDPGGLTNLGISLRSYPWLGREGIAALSQEQAGRIYRRDYFDAVRAAEMPPEIALAALDAAVNQGATWTRRALQVAAGARPDGIIGPKTLKAVQAPGVLEKFLLLRSDRYVQNKNFDAFGKGWMRRLLKITIACMELKEVQKDKEEA
jgi:lysozyme family protein